MGISTLMLKRAIFLDRDGVLNHTVIKNGKPYPPSSVDDLIITNDANDALLQLKKAGFLLIGATNQPDVARGKTTIAAIQAIHDKLLASLPLDEIRVCYHDDSDQCQCRKPAPGLLLEAAKDYGIDLSQSMMIGDRWKDIEAGQRAGCKTIWLNKNYYEPKPKKPPDLITETLTEAVHWILKI